MECMESLSAIISYTDNCCQCCNNYEDKRRQTDSYVLIDQIGNCDKH